MAEAPRHCADFGHHREPGFFGPRVNSLHRNGPRRPHSSGLRHSGRDHGELALRHLARRRPRLAGRHSAGAAARIRSRARTAHPVGRGVVTAKPTGRSLKVKVRTKGLKASSARWLERQLNDPYVAQAKAKGYRSRAAFKLIELDDKFRFLKAGARVLDLGAAPGGWSQVARARIGATGV